MGSTISTLVIVGLLAVLTWLVARAWRSSDTAPLAARQVVIATAIFYALDWAALALLS
jgi:uncharacterized membrane protein